MRFLATVQLKRNLNNKSSFTFLIMYNKIQSFFLFELLFNRWNNKLWWQSSSRKLELHIRRRKKQPKNIKIDIWELRKMTFRIHIAGKVFDFFCQQLVARLIEKHTLPKNWDYGDIVRRIVRVRAGLHYRSAQILWQQSRNGDGNRACGVSV